jgi:predicted O-methyltransferase YrrM
MVFAFNMSPIRYICKYIHYFLSSKRSVTQRYSSSFMNEFLSNVICGSDHFDFKKIETIRKELSKDDSEIEVADMGAGSRRRAGKFRPVAYIVNQASIKPKYGKLLSGLVGWLSPTTIIELGTGAGLSTMYMAAVLSKCKVFSVEGCPEITELAKKNINKLGLRNVEIITGSFNDMLPEILQKIKHDLFVFIDGDHRGDRLTGYFESILPFTNKNTVFVLDDIRWSASMENAWFDIIKRNEVSLSIDLFRMGIIFLKKDMEKNHYVLWY